MHQKKKCRLEVMYCKACEDAPVVEAKAKCEKYKEWCDKNSYVTKRCQKTCGKCSKLPY